MAVNSETDGEWTGLQTDNQADRQIQKQTDRQIQADTSRQKDKDRQLGTERERELKVECRLKLDKNPHRSTPLIGVPPPSVTLINLKESDSLSF